MEKKRSHKALKVFLVLFVLLLLAAAIAFGAAVLLKQNKIKNTTAIAAVVTEEGLSQLEQYPNLAEADLRGSTCYDAILAYQAGHPAVAVLYSVSVDNAEIDNRTAFLDWAGHSPAALTACSPWLQNLTAIDLGETQASAEELEALQQAYPGAVVSYSITYNGKTWSQADTSADFTAFRSADSSALADVLKKLPALQQVSLPEEKLFSKDSYIALYQARPDITYRYRFTLWEQDFSTASTEMKFKKVSIGNRDFAKMEEFLHCLPSLRYISFDRCDIDDSYMVTLRETLPDVKVAWRIYFWQFSVMTDVERIWAIGGLTDEHIASLKYCTDIKYLDLGHNEIHDISFLACMPKLEVCILSMSPIDDISVLANCPELEYLELTLTQVTDLSPLLNCPKLKHLELSQCYSLRDISPLYEIDLERFHMMYNYHAVPQEQIDRFLQLHPGCCVDFGNQDPIDPYFDSDWRYLYGTFTPRYALLREQIGYDDPMNESYLYEWLETD